MRRVGSMLVVVLVGLMAGVVSPPPAAATLQNVKMTQPTHGLSFLPIYVARANRYFEAEGLDVETIVTGGDGPDVQALLARNVDFAASNPKHLYTTYLEEKPLLAVATLIGRCSINLVMHRDVARARGITEATPLAAKLKALRGLTIGATRPGALTYHLALYYITKGSGTYATNPPDPLVRGEGSRACRSHGKRGALPAGPTERGGPPPLSTSPRGLCGLGWTVI